MPGPRKTLEVPRGHRRDKQPLGEATRGKTAPDRLRRLDLWLLRTEGDLLARRDGTPFVDLGYGRRPWTTLQSARALRSVDPRLPVVGVEVDGARVEAAKPHEDPITRFRRGGFDLPLGLVPGESDLARVIRAMNVLRQYDEDAARRAWQLLGERLVDGGVLLDGTCTPFGRLMAVQIRRRVGDRLVDGGLLFSTNFRTPEPPAPESFQAVLPKHLIHRVVPGTRVWAMMQAWTDAWSRARAVETFGRRQVWVRAADGLAQDGWDVWQDRWTLRRGFLLVKGLDDE